MSDVKSDQGVEPARPASGDGAIERRQTALLLGVALLLLVSIIAVAVSKGWPLLFPTVAAVAVSDPGCDLHQGPCTARFRDGATVQFGIEPRPIPVVTPLHLQVQISGLEPALVQIDFAGVDMNMGYNRVALRADGSGRYLGQGTLPVCVRERMEWEARVLLETPEGLLAAPFRFATSR
jgi:hypothetical protein